MMHLSQPRRIVLWAVLGLLAALLCYSGVRGYLSVEMLLNFADLFYC